jgi:hypothetical protein
MEPRLRVSDSAQSDAALAPASGLSTAESGFPSRVCRFVPRRRRRAGWPDHGSSLGSLTEVLAFGGVEPTRLAQPSVDATLCNVRLGRQIQGFGSMLLSRRRSSVGRHLSRGGRLTEPSRECESHAASRCIGVGQCCFSWSSLQSGYSLAPIAFSNQVTRATRLVATSSFACRMTTSESTSAGLSAV